MLLILTEKEIRIEFHRAEKFFYPSTATRRDFLRIFVA